MSSSSMLNDAITNALMFQNGTIDNISFQYTLLKFQQHRPMYQTKYPTQMDLIVATKSFPFLITREIIEHCDLEEDIPLSSLPKCYETNQSYRHILHINQDSTVKTTLQLTLLKHTFFQTEGSISTKDTITFIQLEVNVSVHVLQCFGNVIAMAS